MQQQVLRITNGSVGNSQQEACVTVVDLLISLHQPFLLYSV